MECGSSDQISILQEWDTHYSADSVEWCPLVTDKKLLVCGTYQLSQDDKRKKTEGEIESEESRTKCTHLGRLYLLELSSTSLAVLQSIDMPAILDMKWSHYKVQDMLLLAVCIASGDILIFKLETETVPKLEQITSFNIGAGWESETLALSLDWSIGRHASAAPKLVVSDSKGNITLLCFDTLKLKQECQWNAHGYEAWIAAFSYTNTNVIYTGGDDCILRVFDVRQNEATPVALSRAHTAGVTSLHSSRVKDELLVSGSYDETVRLWDCRQFKHPVNSLNLGGGVWRLKWHPFRHELILSAAMLNGFHIVKHNTNGLDIVCSYKGKHESLAYGVDWVCTNENDSYTVASCSFYDHLLSVWKWTE